MVRVCEPGTWCPSAGPLTTVPVLPTGPASDPKAVRSVYRCRSGMTSGWRDKLAGREFAIVTLSGRSFLYHQVRCTRLPIRDTSLLARVPKWSLGPRTRSCR